MASDVQLEQLLAEAAWIRRLATALVGEEGDDLAQEAWVAILRQPPDPARPPRPWLRRVLENLRASRARAFRRRVQREVAGALEAPSATDPEALTARMQLQARLATLVLGLPEPFRGTIIARYYEGRTASAIAAASGVPAGTVRWRVLRGLELLRAQLDAEAGAREWRLALLALGASGEAPGRGLPPLLLGGVAVKKASVVVGALLVLAALLSVGIWQPWRGPGAVPGAPDGPGRRTVPWAAGGVVPPASGERAGAPVLPSWFAQKGAAHRRVAGTVVREGQPVAGAAVTLTSVLTDAGYLAERSLTTDAQGRFDFGRQPPARFTVSAVAAGMTPAIKEVLVADPSARPSADALVLELRACEHVLAGTVRDASGGVVAGAVVRRSLHGWAPGPAATADAEGRYELCAEGNTRLSVTASGYGALTLYLWVRGRTTRDFVLTPEAQLFGRVVRRADGAPVALAHVFLQSAQPPGWREVSRRTMSDREGRFRLDQVPAGKLRLGAQGDGVAETKWVDVQVAPGELLSGITIALEPAVDVNGTVTAAGRPVAGANVSLLRRDVPTGVARGAVTQEDGRFVVQGVAMGDLIVDVRGYKVLSPAAVRVGAGPVTVAVEVAAIGGIRGRVTADGKPVEGAQVTASGGRLFHHQTTSAADGRFELIGLDAAAYELVATSDRLGRFNATPARVAHVEGAFEELDLELDGGGTIAGQVLDAGGRPVGGVHVRWMREDRQDEGEGMTDEEGRFVARGLAGKGRYRGEVRRSVGAAITLTPTSPFPLVHVPDGASHVTGVALRVDTRTRSIAGRTLMASGVPAVDVKVVAIPVEMKTVEQYAECVQFPMAYSTTDGAFVLEGLSAGQYHVQATSPSGASVTVRAVPAGRSALVVEVPGAGTVRGALAGFTARPLVFVRVERSSRRLLAEVEGDSYRLAGLSPGRYVVVAQNAGEAAATVIEVMPGASTTADLRAAPTASLEGTVTEAGTGTPLAGVQCAVVPDLVEEAHAYFPAWLGMSAQATTDTTGRFVLESVPSGAVPLTCVPNLVTHVLTRVALTLEPGRRQAAAVTIRRRN